LRNFLIENPANFARSFADFAGLKMKCDGKAGVGWVEIQRNFAGGFER
jgi:hypothetical protein